jgi:anhydro-N-acetylmuramic acid kinase
VSANSPRLIVGLISGTSMDGIDAALVRISGPATQPRVRLLEFETMPYPDWVRDRLLAIAGGASTTAEEIDQFDVLLGAAFGKAATGVCDRARVKASRLFAVGSHGQTIHHYGGPRSRSADPHSKVRGLLNGGGRQTADLTSMSALPCTLQIAEPAMIAECTGAPVVSDFRVADMAAGGQGAPLVPMVDYLLLRDAHKGTVALNIGGIANFTVIPANAEPEEVFGFDTGPGNMVIDGLVRHFTKGKKAYDAAGRWAGRGKVIEPLLEEMLRDPFFAMSHPKSAGREQFGQQFIKHHFLRHRSARPQDLVRTATELTACTIVNALERFVLDKTAIHRLIISGGGAHNRLLVSRLGALLPKLRIHRSDEFGLDVDAKEAIAFTVLADRTMHGLPGNLPSVTGARRAEVLGKISRP